MSDSSIVFIELLRREREKVEKKLSHHPKKIESSFGEYFDAQYERLREMMSNKDRKLHKEWEEEYKKRQKEKEKNVQD